MSNNNNCLHVFLSEYIWLNVIATNYENQYSLNNLSKYSIEELTTLAKRFNKKHKAYAGYIAGVAIKTCFEKFPHFSDIPTNLSVQKFLEIIGIEEPEEIVIT